MLETLDPNPVVTLNRAVAVSMSVGPDAGLRLLDRVAADERVQRGHRYQATRAHLLEMAGDLPAARLAFRAASEAAQSMPERAHLQRQVTRLATPRLPD